MNEPHGGWLIDRLVTRDRAAALEAEARALPAVRLNPFELSDLEMLAIGGFSPLDGFMAAADYESVLRQMRLVNGLAWTLPITLAVAEDGASRLRGQSRIALTDGADQPLAVLNVREIFPFDP